MTKVTLTQLQNDDYYKKLITAVLANDITLDLDRLTTHKSFTFTQKQELEKFRDSGVIDMIITGQFDKVSVANLIDIYAIFSNGFTLMLLNKQDYCDNYSESNPLSVN
jgi:hypothetical protein